MVEYALNLDLVFLSLADPTRRDILSQVSKNSLSVGEIAKSYNLTFAAVSKHLKLMEKAQLVRKQRRGKQQIVTAAPATLKETSEYIKHYEAIWNRRFDAMDSYLKQDIN